MNGCLNVSEQFIFTARKDNQVLEMIRKNIYHKKCVDHSAVGPIAISMSYLDKCRLHSIGGHTSGKAFLCLTQVWSRAINSSQDQEILNMINDKQH